jgi:hypothetical protein
MDKVKYYQQIAILGRKLDLEPYFSADYSRSSDKLTVQLFTNNGGRYTSSPEEIQLDIEQLGGVLVDSEEGYSGNGSPCHFLYFEFPNSKELVLIKTRETKELQTLLERSELDILTTDFPERSRLSWKNRPDVSISQDGDYLVIRHWFDFKTDVNSVAGSWLRDRGFRESSFWTSREKVFY